MSKIHTILFILMLATGLFLILTKEKSQVVVNNSVYNFQDVPNTAPQVNENINIWAPDAVEKNDFYEIKYNLDEITDENARMDIERFISSRVAQFKLDSNLESLSEEDKRFLGFYDGFRYTIEFTFDKKESTKIKSYILKIATFTGGAHGNLEISSFNYDKETGQRISLNNIFRRAPAVYLQKLSELGRVFLEEKYAGVAFFEGLAPEPYNWATWYVIDDHLVFIFKPYQVAPWAYGTPEFKIHKNEISEFLNLDYFTN